MTTIIDCYWGGAGFSPETSPTSVECTFPKPDFARRGSYITSSHEAALGHMSNRYTLQVTVR